MYSPAPLDKSDKSRVSDFPVKTFVSPITRTSDFVHDGAKQQKKDDGTSGGFNFTPCTLLSFSTGLFENPLFSYNELY